jgi:hypothetical protein
MNRIFTLVITLLCSVNIFAQKMKIVTLDQTEIEVSILKKNETQKIIKEFEGKQNNSLRKKWTARTFLLSNKEVLVEFYDGQSVLIKNVTDFKKLDRVTFVKNTIWHLKKNISYQIELSYEEGLRILKSEKPKRLTQFKNEQPEYYDFEIYEMASVQILYLEKSKESKFAFLYQDLKRFASDNYDIEAQYYARGDDEYEMQELAKGNTFMDYEPNEHSIYPKYIKEVIKNHQLKKIESKVFVERFWSFLYESENGYFVLINAPNQPNGAGDQMQILDLRIYENLQQVQDAQAKYEDSKEEGFTSEHFFQQISDKYGAAFPQFTKALIDTLPFILNFDSEQLTFDDKGIEIIEEALSWNAENYELFDDWFPSVLAYYGEFYIKNKSVGKWKTSFDKKENVWIPFIVLEDNSSAFDIFNFYKELMEGPSELKWAGDYFGIRLNRRKN